MQTSWVRKNSYLQWHWEIPLALAVVALVVMIMGDGVAETLRYQREAILEGDLWRLLSGHLVHLGWVHLLLNLAGLVLMWVFAGDSLTASGWWWMIVFCALCVSLGLLLFNPQLQWYVGLSGILHGLLLGGLLARMIGGSRDLILLLVVLAVKLSWEQFSGPLPGSETGIGGTVVVDAHLYGAIGGGLSVILSLGLPGLRRRFLQ